MLRDALSIARLGLSAIWDLVRILPKSLFEWPAIGIAGQPSAKPNECAVHHTRLVLSIFFKWLIDVSASSMA